MAQRRAVTNRLATRYRQATRPEKSEILDQLVELTGWHRDHARAELRRAGTVRVVRPRAARARVYSSRIVSALELVWRVARHPAGKRLAPMLVLLVPMLRRDGEIDLTDDEADLLVAMSAATIDRRLQGAKVLAAFAGRSHTKPGSLLKSQIPIRTWSEWDENTPGFVEIDLVGHEGGNSFGEFCFTLTVTDIATGWTVNRTVINKAAIHVVAALDQRFTNLVCAQQQLISRHRVGAKVIKHHDPAQTPHQRALAAGVLTPATEAGLTRALNGLHPGELSRQIDTLVARLEHLALTKTTTTAPPPGCAHLIWPHLGG